MSDHFEAWKLKLGHQNHNCEEGGYSTRYQTPKNRYISPRDKWNTLRLQNSSTDEASLRDQKLATESLERTRDETRKVKE